MVWEESLGTPPPKERGEYYVVPFSKAKFESKESSSERSLMDEGKKRKLIWTPFKSLNIDCNHLAVHLLTFTLVAEYEINTNMWMHELSAHKYQVVQRNIYIVSNGNQKNPFWYYHE